MWSTATFLLVGAHLIAKRKSIDTLDEEEKMLRFLGGRLLTSDVSSSTWIHSFCLKSSCQISAFVVTGLWVTLLSSSVAQSHKRKNPAKRLRQPQQDTTRPCESVTHKHRISSHVGWQCIIIILFKYVRTYEGQGLGKSAIIVQRDARADPTAIYTED